MREELGTAEFLELVANIRAVGLLQPLLVTAIDGRYRLVAGYRRWRAAIEAGLVTVPCVEQPMSRLAQATAMIVENLHREHVNPLDEARKFAELEDEHGLSVEEIAQLVGKSLSYVGTRLTILRAPEDVKAALRAEQIPFSVARELARCPYDAEREWLLGHAISGGATTDTVRRWVQDVNTRKREAPEGTVVTMEQLSGAPPPVIMAVCEWHRGEVPANATLGFNVCQGCYEELRILRDEVAKARAAAEAAT